MKKKEWVWMGDERAFISPKQPPTINLTIGNWCGLKGHWYNWNLIVTDQHRLVTIEFQLYRPMWEAYQPICLQFLMCHRNRLAAYWSAIRMTCIVCFVLYQAVWLSIYILLSEPISKPIKGYPNVAYMSQVNSSTQRLQSIAQDSLKAQEEL